jgi:curved DNA-binding protein CbpA
MPDHFATLSQPRLPWLDPEKLKEIFLKLSAEIHPDRVHNSNQAEKEAAQARYTDLNEAYRCLSDSRERLRHLIELETGRRPAEVQAVPDGMLELFMQISPRLREADSFAPQRASAQSPLMRVRLLQQSQATIDQLQSLQQQLDENRARLEAELKIISSTNDDDNGCDWERLEEIYRRFSYVNRWSSQIRERILNLSP